MKHALVFGGSGSAGSYLVEQLLADGYRVTSTHHNSHPMTGGWSSDKKNHHSYWLDAKNFKEVKHSIEHLQPDLIFNLIAAKIDASKSWADAEYLFDINGRVVLTMLEAIKKYCPDARFVNAGSANMYGIWKERHISIFSERRPRNPYALAKSMAFDAVRVYRQEKGLKCCTAIFFNMESPRRSGFYFASTVAKSVVKFAKKEIDKIVFGDLSAVRDWGWAPEYMEAMRMMAAQDQMQDYVIATGESYSCRSFVQEALCCAGAPVGFGEHVVEDVAEQKGTVMRASVIPTTMELGWQAKVKFKDVVRLLVEAEMAKYPEKSVTA